MRKLFKVSGYLFGLLILLSASTSFATTRIRLEKTLSKSNIPKNFKKLDNIIFHIYDTKTSVDPIASQLFSNQDYDEANNWSVDKYENYPNYPNDKDDNDGSANNHKNNKDDDYDDDDDDESADNHKKAKFMKIYKFGVDFNVTDDLILAIEEKEELWFDIDFGDGPLGYREVIPYGAWAEVAGRALYSYDADTLDGKDSADFVPISTDGNIILRGDNPVIQTLSGGKITIVNDTNIQGLLTVGTHTIEIGTTEVGTTNTILFKNGDGNITTQGNNDINIDPGGNASVNIASDVNIQGDIEMQGNNREIRTDANRDLTLAPGTSIVEIAGTNPTVQSNGNRLTINGDTGLDLITSPTGDINLNTQTLSANTTGNIFLNTPLTGSVNTAGNLNVTGNADITGNVDTAGNLNVTGNADVTGTANATQFIENGVDVVNQDDLTAHENTEDAHHAKTTKFSELTDAATNAQIPDNITINYAASAGNADTVDGIHASELLTNSHEHPTVSSSNQSPNFSMHDYTYDDTDGEGTYHDEVKEAYCPYGQYVAGIKVHYGGTCQNKCNSDGGTIRNMTLVCRSVQIVQ